MTEKETDHCGEVRESFADYLEGRLEESRREKIDGHLKECEECAKIFEAAENRAFSGGSGADAYNAGKIEFKFTKKIITRLFTIIFIGFMSFYILFSFILPLLFSRSTMTKSEYAGYAVSDLIQFTMPGAWVDDSSITNNVDMFNIYSLVEFKKLLSGGGAKKGKFDLAVPVYIGISDLKISWSTEENGSGISFENRQASNEGPDNQWNKLEKLKSGTKCQIAVYFPKSMSLGEMEEILNLIEGDDSHTWLAIDTGNDEWEKNVVRSFNYSIEWGFPMHLQLTPATADTTGSEKGRVISMSMTMPQHSVATVAGKFKKEMKAFEQYSTILHNDEFRSKLIEMNQFLSGGEIRIRGALLAASTENMLRLRGYPGLARADILKVDFDY